MVEPLPHLGLPHRLLAVPPSPGQPTDIINLIVADHRRIRRLCQALQDAARWSDDPGRGWMLAPIWERLAGLLERHARAEEEICYLPMFRRLPHPTEGRREAIADHDDIREAIAEASLQCAGSVPWWRAVRAVAVTSVRHIDREEDEVLAEALLGVTMTWRRELGRQWCAFTAAWRSDATSRNGVLK